MTSTKPFYKYLATFLLLFFISGIIDMPVKAASNLNQTSEKSSIKADIGEIPHKLPKSKLELTSKRTKYSTRYLNPDGSFTEEIFLEPQFYQDSTDKKWKKLDNTLKVSSKDASKLENTSNDFTATFASQAGAEEVVSVEKEGKKIALVPVGGKATKGTVKNNEITYADMFNNTDAKYTVKGDSVKEDLILNSYSNQNTFTFEVKLNGLKAAVEKDGTITFSDSKSNKVWYFENPYMVDANGKYSKDVKLNLRAVSGKTYVDVVADKTFLEDPNTKYPVAIDPTINDWDILRDTFISSSQPDTAYSSNTSMYTGLTTSFGNTRSLAQFYIPSLPSDSKISSANFNAYQIKNDATSVSVDLFRITNSWTGSSTWNTQPSTNATPESTVTNNTYNQYWQWDTTQLVIDWYNGVLPNYGFMLKQQNESTSPYREFTTVNSGNHTPRLTINYTVDPIGLEDFWSYTKDGVNPSNGNLVLQNNDVSVPGRGVPVSVTRTYNSRKSNIANSFGYGWISNLEAKLVDSGSGPITLIDGDNTRHIFGQKVGGGYESAGGVYLNLVKNGDGTYTITQIDGTKINFNTSGKISSMVDTNGNITAYTYNASSKLSTITDASGRATTISYGTNGYVSSITDSANHTTSYDYDGSGNLIKVTDAASNFTTFAYNADHNLTSVTDARNITTTIAYDASDRVSTVTRPITIDGTVTSSVTSYSYDTTNMVTSVTDGEGKRIDYTYNANGNVVQVTENPLDSAKKAVTTFSYDNNNNLVEVKDANTNKVSGTSSYVYTYDSNGNITSVKLPENQSSTYTHDGNNNVTSQNDFNGNISTFGYDPQNNNTEATDPNTQTAASRYASNGNLLYSTQPMSTADNLISNSSFETDNNSDNWPDNWTSATESGKTATFAWSATSKFGSKSVSISNPTGWAIAYSDTVPYVAGDKYIVSGYVKTAGTTNTAIVKVEFFDSQSNWLGQKSAYTLKGDQDWTRIQAVVDSIPSNTSKVRVSVGLNAGSGTAYFDGIQLEKGTVLGAYNLVDNSSFEKDSNSDKIPDNWTTSDNLSVNDGIQSSEVYTENNSFKLTGESGKNKYIKQHINFSGDVNIPLTLSGWSKQVGANVNGGNYLLQVAINNTDGTVDWTNANNFSKTVTGWQHAAAEIKPQKAFNSVDVYYYFYDQTGSAYFDSMRLEAQGTFTTNSYDANGNYVTSVKDSNGNTVSFSNDASGNKTSVTDAKSKITSFEYNPLNLLTKVTDAKNGVTSYEYDGGGNRTKVTDARNNATTYNYNEFNKVSKITNPLNQILQFGYDKNGNSTKVIFPKGDTISYSYDVLNRNDGVYYNGTQKWGFGYDTNGNLTSATETSSGKTTSYSYDKNNRVTEASEGASNKIDYTFDDNNNQTNLAITAGSTTVNNGSSYNSLNQLIALSRNSSNIISFVYDERGNIISASRANGTYTAFEYDSGNRVKSVKNYRAEGLLIDSYTYSYDGNSNIASVVTNGGTILYQYDELNQLTQETLLDGTVVSYEYDAAGNRTKKTVNQGGNITTTNYTNDAGNQLTAVNGQGYIYDANGNLTNNGAKTFVYDVENHLTQVKDSQGTVIASFTYDHEGKRISIITQSGTTYFHYSGDKVAYETDSNNNITAEYTWDAQGNPVTMTKNGVTYYYHVNAHGDVTALTDASGNIAAQYSYDAWGNILSQIGTMASSNPYRYAGYRYDDGTGLYYLMARYYDANVGRFINADNSIFIKTLIDKVTNDPANYKGNLSMMSNLFAYCINNPINNTDDDGRDPYVSKWMKAVLTVQIILEVQLIRSQLAINQFIQHVAERAVDRGITPMKIINAIRYGDTYLDPANNYRTVFYRGGIAVVVEGKKIITVMVTRVMKRWLRF